MSMKAPCPRLIVGALRGGAGKTTLSAGMLAALRKRGISSAPFKKGPDFIDAAWLSCASGQSCHNLDSFLMDSDTVVHSFLCHSAGADMALIEGNRGLFDGMDHKGTHSTAQMAKLLAAPVVMVMDCDKVTRTASAMMLGCRMLDPDIDIRGVILNRISGPRHESILKRTIEETCCIPVIGAVPRMKDFPFPERNLGLTPPQEHSNALDALNRASVMAENHIDLDAILDIASHAAGALTWIAPNEKSARPISRSRIGVFRDSAFQFYYPENLAALRDRGAEVVDISPLRDKRISAGIDLLYIGGGFPETHAEALAENRAFRSSLHKAAEEGLPIYAECGGLMYLGESLSIGEKTYPMSGALPVSFAMVEKLQGHGYTLMDVVAENPFFHVGITLKGHEFHHSRMISADEKQIRFAFRVKRGTGVDGLRDGLCRNNILGSYTHIHALGTREWADGIINRADACRLSRLENSSLDYNPGHHGSGAPITLNT